MSEDPAKYEYQSNPGSGSTTGNAAVTERLRIDTLTGRKEASERAQMIRIEALRAAAALMTPMLAEALRVGFATVGPQEASNLVDLAPAEVISTTKQFAAYLETGE